MPWHLYDRPRLRELAEQRPWFEYTEVVSDDPSYPGTRGKVGTVAARQALHGRTAMVCGGPQMVAHTLEQLTATGMRPEHIKYEHFYYAAADEHTAAGASDQVRRQQMTNSDHRGLSALPDARVHPRRGVPAPDAGARRGQGVRVPRPAGRPGAGHRARAAELSDERRAENERARRRSSSACGRSWTSTSRWATA